jgi:long-chain acyl-CoA synthetase
MRYKDEVYETRAVADLRELMNSGAELYGDRAAYLVKDRPGGRFVPVSYRQFRADVTALGAALASAGYLLADSPSEGCCGMIAIISENRYEYVVAYFAVVCGGGTVVPIDPRLPRAETENLLCRSGAAAVFYSKKYGAPGASGDTGNPEKPGQPVATASAGGCEWIAMDEVPALIAKGEVLVRGGDDRYFRAAIDPRRMCVLLFTSGTTGAAKGAMLSHANLVSNVMGMSAFIDAGGRVSLSVLPMHHALEFTCDILAAMYQGCTVAICEGLRYIKRDLAESGAEVVVGVPLVFEKMHRNIMKTAGRVGRYELLRAMVNLSKLAGGVPFASRLMFRSVRRALGGKVKLFLVGGAPCDPAIISDFNAMGIKMIQGYGMTESSPIISVGKDKCSKDASVGMPLHGTFVQIDDDDADGVGEIVIAGPSVMLGYYGDEVATRAAMPDGRLRTGDLGRFDEDGFLYITGRAKNVIVLKNGKNVYPEEVESRLLKSRYIEEVVVSAAGGASEAGPDSKVEGGDDEAAAHGQGFFPKPGAAFNDSNAPTAVAAEIFPDIDAIRRDFGEACDDDVRKIIEREVDRVNESMPPHMRVLRTFLRSAPFDKTTTKKIRRGFIKVR